MKSYMEALQSDLLVADDTILEQSWRRYVTLKVNRLNQCSIQIPWSWWKLDFNLLQKFIIAFHTMQRNKDPIQVWKQW